MMGGHRHPAARAGSGEGLEHRLWISAGLNLAITFAELAGGALAGSLALLSDAAHNLGDVAALLMALWARRFAQRPATTRHTYGFKRVEVGAAMINALLLVGATVLIAREAVLHLLHPAPLASGVMLAVAVPALLANVGSVLVLRRHERTDVNVRSAFLHMTQDALASLAVVIAALLARAGAGSYVDPIAALIVSAVVLRSVFSLLWETTFTLLESAPRDVDVAEVADRVANAFAPASLHHVHVWEIGPEQRLLTAHVALGREMDARGIECLLADIKELLLAEWGINHATLEPELTGCERPELLGDWPPAYGDTAGRRSPQPGLRNRSDDVDSG
jgi:cobalt-zinc-cadmium efflux system protein